MRVISMQFTHKQFCDGSKDVTRRLGWLYAVPGLRLRVVRQAMGLKWGQHMETLGYVELVNVRREPLSRMIADRNYGPIECRREGFPEWTPDQFVRFFCETHFVKPYALVTRLEYKRIEVDDGKERPNAQPVCDHDDLPDAIDSAGS